MRRTGPQLTDETLLADALFILKKLQRTDLFGERVRLREAEHVLGRSLALNFMEYCGFLEAQGYIQLDQAAAELTLNPTGAQAAQETDPKALRAQLSGHFAAHLAEALPTPAPSQVTPLEDVLDRRYRRGAQLGEGTLGPVYRGAHLNLARAVAIKQVERVFQLASYLRRDELLRRLRGALEAQASLSHPNIAQLLDFNLEREQPYYVLALAEGGSLRQRMDAAEGGLLPFRVALRAMLQLAYALRYAHAEGVVHGGLKPENVLFDVHGNVLLSDFGLAEVTQPPAQAGQSSFLVGGGAVAYMAPELLQPGLPAQGTSPAADVYSLGILFYEVLTGKLPGRRSPLPSLARKEVPSAFDDVFDHMTRDDLSERYKSIDEVLTGLYRAFPSKEVFTRGAVLQWADDPAPLPAPEPAPVLDNNTSPDLILGPDGHALPPQG